MNFPKRIFQLAFFRLLGGQLFQYLLAQQLPLLQVVDSLEHFDFSSAFIQHARYDFGQQVILWLFSAMPGDLPTC
jgi:hypothetical protein